MDEEYDFRRKHQMHIALPHRPDPTCDRCGKSDNGDLAENFKVVGYQYFCGDCAAEEEEHLKKQKEEK